MTGFHLQLDHHALDAALNRFRSAATSNPQAMKAAGDVLYQYVLNTFRDQQDPWGHPWADWSPATLAGRRSRKDFRLQKLVDSRDMVNSVEVRPPTGNSVTIEAGNNASAAYIEPQQFGNEKIPARPFFPMRSEDDSGSFPQDWLDNIFAPIQRAMEAAAQ